MKKHSLIFQQSVFGAIMILLVVLLATGIRVADAKGNIPPQKAYELLVKKGLTCELQETLIALDNDQRSALGKLVYDNISSEEIEAIIEEREMNCFAPNDVNQDMVYSGGITPLITSTYAVEFIEETTGSGGYYPTTIFRDSSSSNWMCNSGSPESPADYVAQYYVPNSYSNRSNLRIRGTNSFASCYIGNPTASRVYSDNDIRACLGYWTVYFCTLGTGPTTYESVIWIQ